MKQLALFDSPVKSPAPRIARDSDPSTSHQAATETVRHIGKLHAQVLACFRNQADSLTAREAASLCYSKDTSVEVETYRKRVKEFVDAGKLIVCETRTCLVTGKRASVYWEAGR